MSEYNYEERKSSSADSKDIKIHLSKNFRSRSEVLETVNVIFKNIMSVEFGEMDYTEKEWLLHGRDEAKRESKM